MKRYAFATSMLLLVVFPWRQTPQADTPAFAVEALNALENIGNLVPAETGINASGQISGTVTDSAGNQRAVRYTDGVGWEYVPGLTWGSSAAGINVHGDIVGTRLVGAVNHAYRYNFATGVVDDILPLTGGSSNNGFGINDSGDVVGQSDVGNGIQRGFVAHPGQTPIVLPTLGGTDGITDSACGINNAGQIAETSTLPTGLPHGARIEADDATILDAGTVDGTFGMSAACAIDDAGHIGGFSSAQTFGSFHAFRWDPANSVIADAGLPSSFGNVESIAGGVSAGWYQLANGTTFALTYSDANGAVDLNTQLPANSGWVLTQVKGINATGQMVGDGLFNGVPTVFRMGPAKTKDTTAPVISGLTVTPSTISTVNGQLVNVAVNFLATDDSGQIPTCPLSASGPGVAGTDYAVTGPNSGNVKAVGGRTYTFTVTCTDGSGNSSSMAANVVVQSDTTAPTINSMTASPSPIWPPKGQMVPVSVNVAATDDSGVVSCKLTSITVQGAATADAQITGDVAGNVKAVGGRTYTFTAQCTDFSGNTKSASVDVLVTPDTTAPTITTFTLSPSTIDTPNNLLVNVQATIQATDDVDDAPGCSLTGITAGGASATFSITGPTTAQVQAKGGTTYTLTATCSDFTGNKSTRTSTVTVPPDTKPPVISSVTASPSTIWPPNGQLVTVNVTINATDDSGVVACRLASISGPGTPGVDYQVTGIQSGSVRAVGGRTYTFTAQCVDLSRNASTASTTVFVTPDTTAPVISMVYASPDAIWPPNGKMVAVGVMVTATDDVDGTPSCSLTSISGGGTGSSTITGPLSAAVRADGGAVYALTVTCSDRAGNTATASTTVAVTKTNGNGGTAKASGKQGTTTFDFDRDDRDDRHDNDKDKDGKGRKERGGLK